MHLPISTTIPNPYVPVTRATATSCSGLYRRRAEILAATRRTLAREGHQQFTLRSVSQACNVTVQTIHNSFGCKIDLALAALEQHTQQLDAFALSQIDDPRVFITLARAYYISTIEWSDFMREKLLLTSYRPQLRDSLFKYGADLKAYILRGMARRNLLRPSVDLRLAAEQIAYLIMFCLLDWAETGDLKRLEERLINGHGVLLLGIFKSETAREIEQWLGDLTSLDFAGTFGPELLQSN